MNSNQHPHQPGETTVSVNPLVAEFLLLLGRADSVVADSAALTGWDTADATGQEDNEVVRLSWVEDEGMTHGLILAEGAIARGKWVGSSFFCESTEGDDVQISLYTHQALTPASPQEAGAQKEVGSVGSAALPALADLVGILLRADKQGGIWQALYNEGVTDAYTESLAQALKALGDEGVADIAARYELDLDELVERARADAANESAESTQPVKTGSNPNESADAFLATLDDVAAVLRENAVRIHDSGGKSMDTLAAELFDDLHLDAISAAARAFGVGTDVRTRGAHREIAQQLVDLGFLKGEQRILRVNVVLLSGDPKDDYDGFEGLFDIEFDEDLSHLPLAQRATVALQIHDHFARIKGNENFSIVVLDPAGYVITPEPTSVECSGGLCHSGEAIKVAMIKLDEWQAELSKLALGEGWDVFDCDGSENGRWQICRNDDPDDGPHLESDDMAWKIVMEGHKPHHAAAREFIRQHNPVEWWAINRYMAGLKIPGSTPAN